MSSNGRRKQSPCSVSNDLEAQAVFPCEKVRDWRGDVEMYHVHGAVF